MTAEPTRVGGRRHHAVVVLDCADLDRITDHPVEEDGWTWHVLADPDDNEFCVLTAASVADVDR